MSTAAVEFLHSFTADKQVTLVDLSEIGRPAKDLAATPPQTGAGLCLEQDDSVVSAATLLGDEALRRQVFLRQMFRKPLVISSKVFLIS